MIVLKVDRLSQPFMTKNILIVSLLWQKPHAVFDLYKKQFKSAWESSLVLLQWGWNYFTRGRGARLITGQISEEKLVETSFNNENYDQPQSNPEKVISVNS